MKKTYFALGGILAAIVLFLVLGAAAPAPVQRNQFTTNVPGAVVLGPVAFDGAVNIAGASGHGGLNTFTNGTANQGSATITGTLRLGDTLTATGAVTVGTTANITGASFHGGIATFTNGTANQGAATITGAVGVGGTLTASNALQVNGVANIVGASTYGGTATFTNGTVNQGNASVTGTLNAGGAATFTGTVYTASSATAAGGLIATNPSVGVPALKITGIANTTTNIFEVWSNATIYASVSSNGTFQSQLGLIANGQTTYGSGFVSSTPNTGLFQMAGGTQGGSANFLLYGGAEATTPNEFRFRQGISVIWKIATSTGHWLAGTDDTYDVGATNASRPRIEYISRGLVLGASGSILTNILTGRANLDFPSTAASSSSDLSITVTGATTNDVASVQAPPVTQLANSAFTCFASNNTVYVRFSNFQAVGSLDPGAASFSVIVHRF